MVKKLFNLRSIIMLTFIIAVSLFQMHVIHLTNVDTDLLWHYKLGEEIIDIGKITFENKFTFLEGTEWIHQEWLYDLLLYLIISIWDLAGYFWLCILNSIIYWSIAAKGKNNLILFSITSFILLYISPRNIGNRPSEFSIYFIFGIIYLYNKNIKNIKFIIYFILGILVANFHGGTLLVISAVYLIMIINDLFIDLYTGDKLGIRYYIIKIAEFIIFISGAVINPSGIRLLNTITKIPSLETTKRIIEWQHAEVGYILGVFIFGIVISFGYYIGKYGINRSELQLILINTALLILSLHSIRAFIIFDIAWMIYGYKYLEIMLTDIFKGKFSKFNKITYYLKSVIPASLIFIIIISSDGPDVKQDNFEDYVNKSCNIDILTELKSNYTDEDRILSGYVNGNFLIFNNMKCFIDTRQWPYVKELSKCTALDDLFYVTYNLQDEEFIDEFIDKYKFNYIWTDKKLNLNSYLKDRDDYELIISTDNKYESLWKKID